MARPLVPDELWELVRPLLLRHRNRAGSGTRGASHRDREALTGILFVFRKLRFVTEKDEETKFAFFNLGMAIIAFRCLYPNAFC